MSRTLLMPFSWCWQHLRSDFHGAGDPFGAILKVLETEYFEIKEKNGLKLRTFLIFRCYLKVMSIGLLLLVFSSINIRVL